MAGKNSFVLRNEYLDIFEDLSDKQAGSLIKTVYRYAVNGEEPEGLNDEAVKMAFRFIKKDIDYDTAKYNELCEKRSEAGKSGGRPNEKQKKQMLFEKAKGFSEKQKKQMLFEKAKGFSEKQKKHSDSVSDSDSVVVSDSDNKLLTADTAAEQAGKSPNPKKLNPLQNFSNSVIAAFEDNMNDTQKGIWFKRNCRCLSDILNFCSKDIPLALETISVCVERLEKAGLKGGYEAVCRNLPDYYEQAKERLEKRRLNAQESEF